MSKAIKNIFLLLCACVFFSGCASLQKTLALLQDPSSRAVTDRTPKLYAQATRDLESEKFAKAQTEFEAFLTEQPTSAYTQVAKFNLGRALMGEKKFTQATEQMRAVANETSGNAPQIQAQAFYQLSFCYEALGDKIDALATLLDSYRRQKYFRREVASAEIPARIAGAYAALGNFSEAKNYYAQAEAGIGQLKRGLGSGEVPEWLPRTLFYMGEVSLRKISWEDVSSVLRPLSRAQIYLLEAAELGLSSWSQKSAQELIATYQSTLAVIAHPPEAANTQGVDQISLRRSAQEKQWQLAQEFYQVLDEMKSYESPEQENLTANAKNIFSSALETKEKLLAILSEPKIGQDITEDAQERKAKRHGLAHQKPIQKSNKKPGTSPTSLPEGLPTAVPPKDPNL